MSVDSSKVYLLEVASTKGVEAELRDAIEPANVLDWQNAWKPAIDTIQTELTQRNVPRDQWPQSLHWNWPLKVAQVQGLLAYKGFTVTCGGMTQGMMRVVLTRLVRLPPDQNKPLVYVDYLESAPWNWSEPVLKRPPRYRGLGIVFISAAIQLSLDEGFGGRVGLHSLPQSEQFYRDRLKMNDLGPDVGYQNLRYFEMSTQQAQAFIGKGSGG